MFFLLWGRTLVFSVFKVLFPGLSSTIHLVLSWYYALELKIIHVSLHGIQNRYNFYSHKQDIISANQMWFPSWNKEWSCGGRAEDFSRAWIQVSSGFCVHSTRKILLWGEQDQGNVHSRHLISILKTLHNFHFPEIHFNSLIYSFFSHFLLCKDEYLNVHRLCMFSTIFILSCTLSVHFVYIILDRKSGLKRQEDICKKDPSNCMSTVSFRGMNPSSTVKTCEPTNFRTQHRTVISLGHKCCLSRKLWVVWI